MAGTKISGGTIGWTRESRSSESESNIRGEAFRMSERRACILRPNVAPLAAPRQYG